MGKEELTVQKILSDMVEVVELLVVNVNQLNASNITAAQLQKLTTTKNFLSDRYNQLSIRLGKILHQKVYVIIYELNKYRRRKMRILTGQATSGNKEYIHQLMSVLIKQEMTILRVVEIECNRDYFNNSIIDSIYAWDKDEEDKVRRL